MTASNNNSICNFDKWVIGNWKMNGRLSYNENYLEELLPKIEDLVINESIFCGLAVPNPYLFQFGNRLIDSLVHLGVQDISSENNDGAHTGDVSGEMVREFDCSFAIIGHSELRMKYKEPEANLVRKVKISVKNKILPVICVGETLKNREEGKAEVTVKTQVKSFTSGLSKDELSNCIFAYEPLWAIGTGENAKPSDAEIMHQLIRFECENALGSNLANKVKVLYGGSVKSENAEEYFLQPGVDGALVGGASLDASEFSKIIDKAIATSLNN